LHAMLAKEPHRRPTAGEVELALAGLPQNSPGPRSSETRFRTNAAPVSSDFSDRSLAPVNRGGAIVEPGKHPQTRGQASSRPQDALWRLTHASQPKSRLTVAAIAAAVILVAVVIWWMTRGQP